MAKAVTLKNFQSWLEKNEDKTWFLPTFGPESTWKYFDLHFDTRTMTIYGITARGKGIELKVHVGETYSEDQTLLELLDEKIAKK